jgi:glycyl-tRNA synthetase beta chain
VFANRPASPLDALLRLEALQEFLRLPEAAVLCAINKRIGNILKKTVLAPGARVDAAALAEQPEKRLQRVLEDLAAPVRAAATAHRYTESLSALVALRAPVDEFFERVMVMADDAGVRNNRLALLRDVQDLLGGIVDLSRLPG